MNSISLLARSVVVFIVKHEVFVSALHCRCIWLSMLSTNVS